MLRFVNAIPKYRRHRASDQAVVSLGGQDFYLGPHGTKASKIAYDRLIGEWLAGGRQLASLNAGDLTTTELIAHYWEFAKQHYRKDGQPTQEVSNIRYALRPVRQLYAATPAREFGPLALKAIQQRFIRDGICRTQINQRVGKIKRLFKWAVSEQLVPANVFQALQTVVGLQAGRTEVRESPPVLPVPDEVVDATIPHLPAVVADMVRFHRLTGGRPGEISSIRPCDVDTSNDVWVYKPASHKTQHHGRERRIFIGPKAQDVLRPYLLREKQSYCFMPAESEIRRRNEIHETRKTPLHHGNRPGSNRKRKPRRTPGDRYDKDAYNRAIRRGVEKANAARFDAAVQDGINPEDVQRIPRWHANQLRHSVATKSCEVWLGSSTHGFGTCRSEDHTGVC